MYCWCTCGRCWQPVPAAAPSAQPGPLTPEQQQQLAALTSQQPVMVFMKGSPEAPRCGFSRKVVEALSSDGIAFGSFDILSDDFVRQGLKAYSQWPTYPQVRPVAGHVQYCRHSCSFHVV